MIFMKILPILFNTEMVKALLDGRKTCTRRKIPINIVNNCDIDSDDKLHSYQNSDGCSINSQKLCQFHPGDVLYVRETWQVGEKVDYFDQVIEGTERYFYKAGPTPAFDFWVDSGTGEHKDHIPWKPSIHMPKKAARIWLKVTDVRVERLQEITEDGAKEEGAIDNRSFIHSPDNEYNYIHTAKEHFIDIWNSTIKKSDIDTYGWDVNPWVWVIDFERCKKPLECILNGYDKAPDDCSGRCLGYMYDDNSDTLLPMCEECSCQASYESEEKL